MNNEQIEITSLYEFDYPMPVVSIEQETPCSTSIDTFPFASVDEYTNVFSTHNPTCHPERFGETAAVRA